jgi:hypothetical protein
VVRTALGLQALSDSLTPRWALPADLPSVELVNGKVITVEKYFDKQVGWTVLSGTLVSLGGWEPACWTALARGSCADFLQSERLLWVETSKALVAVDLRTGHPITTIAYEPGAIVRRRGAMGDVLGTKSKFSILKGTRVDIVEAE